MSKTAKTIAIPKTFSRPVDPNAPSLLTTIPGEIRNHIYRLLFEFHDTVEVTDYGNYLGTNRTACARSQIGSAIPLLRSCRQIYHEAVGILYHSNRFRLSAKYRGRRFEQWTATIGIQIHLLRTVVLDLTVLTRVACCDDAALHILPVLRFVWTTSTTGPDVSFTRYNTTVLEPFNAAFKLIVSEDRLNIRRYATSRGILTAVTLEVDGSGGRVVFGSTADVCKVERSFQVSFDRTTVTMDQPERHLDFLGLPFQIYDKIMKYAFYQEHGIVTDRNTVFQPQLDLRLSHVNRKLMDDARRYIFEPNRFTLRFFLTSHRTSFDEFSGFERWLSPLVEPISTLSSEWDRSYYEKFIALPKQLEFVFEMEVAQKHRAEKMVANARIDILQFLRFTRYAPLSTTISCNVSYSHDSNKESTETLITLQKLRFNVFIALSYLLVSRPWRETKVCPKIYINEHGSAVEIWIPGHKKVQKLPDAARPSEGKDAANRQLEEFWKQLERYKKYWHPMNITSQRVNRQLTLVDMWNLLRLTVAEYW